MKIRNGFVSNSSSMSFIVRNDKYKTVKELAKAMIDYRAKIDDWYKKESGRYKEDLKELNKIKDPNQSIAFYTCNFDTYIYKDGDKFLVETCNNHNCWNFLDYEFEDFKVETFFYHLNRKDFIQNKMEGGYWW